MRRKVRRGADGSGPVLLMVHGSTYPLAATYDLPLGGVSLMDLLAGAGVDVWALDVVGYGGSSRPAEMSLPPEQGTPVSRTADAVSDLACAVGHLSGGGVNGPPTLLGWSWGASIVGSYVAGGPDRARRLVQLAPQWLRSGPSATDPGGRIGAYRVVDADDVFDRWARGLTPEQSEAIIPPDAPRALRAALVAADVGYSAAHPGRFRAPNGTIVDTREFWAAGRPLYDPAAIRCPVLLIHGTLDREWPRETALAYYAKLSGAARRRRHEIADGTHSLLIERCRDQIAAEIARFVLDSG